MTRVPVAAVGNGRRLIPRTIPKFAGTPVTALDFDDLRYLLRHARRDRLLAAAVERELIRRAPSVLAPATARHVHPPPAAPEGVPCRWAGQRSSY